MFEDLISRFPRSSTMLVSYIYLCAVMVTSALSFRHLHFEFRDYCKCHSNLDSVPRTVCFLEDSKYGVSSTNLELLLLSFSFLEEKYSEYFKSRKF